MPHEKHAERCPKCGRRQTRSTQANARLWLLYHALSEKLPVRGQTFSADAWHEYMKGHFLGKDDVLLPNGKTSTRTRSTAKLDVAAFSDYMTAVEAWANEHDVYLDEIFEG